jgi:hypothetical protein
MDARDRASTREWLSRSISSLRERMPEGECRNLSIALLQQQLERHAERPAPKLTLIVVGGKS